MGDSDFSPPLSTVEVFSWQTGFRVMAVSSFVLSGTVPPVAEMDDPEVTVWKGRDAMMGSGLANRRPQSRKHFMNDFLGG